MKWETVKLTDVCDFQGGTQPPKSSWSTDHKPGYVRMLQIRDFTQGKDSFIEYVKDIKTLKKCNAEDILIGRYGASIGKILTGLSGAYNVALVKTVPTKRISRRYLYFYLLSDTFQNFIQNAGSRAAQAGFNKEELGTLYITLPPLHIQEQIADTLDKADALRRKDQKLLQKYDELAQSIFYDMFGDPVRNEKGWEKSTLKELVHIDTKSVKPEDTVGRHYVGLENVEKESGTVTWSKEVDLKSNKFLFDRSCILYGKLRPYLKKVATPNFDGVCSTDIFPIRCKGLEKEFAATILRTEHFTDYANSSSVGANLPRVNKEVILSYETIRPPMRLQENYSIKINQIKLLKSDVNKSKVALELMQSSLFKSFFS